MIRMLRLAASRRLAVCGHYASSCNGELNSSPSCRHARGTPPVSPGPGECVHRLYGRGYGATEASQVQVQVVGRSLLRRCGLRVSDLSEDALYEFEFWDDPAAPARRSWSGTPERRVATWTPPPENDPNVIFPVTVHAGVPYRCWLHMKVGAPKGLSTANKAWVQFTGAVDAAGNEVFAPDTGSFLTVQGPTEEGWTWLGAICLTQRRRRAWSPSGRLERPTYVFRRAWKASGLTR